jgi:uncharacterized protein
MTLGVLIVARAPRAGEVKTRLEPLLGPEGCARLQTELICHTAEWATCATRHVWLAFTPADAHDELAALAPATVRLFAQEGRDLGQRLRNATAVVFQAHRGALAVVGTDATGLRLAHLRLAERELASGHDAAVIPALDGGYALIALARPTPQAFQLPAASWGGPHVLALTLASLQDAGYSCAVLKPVRDLDTPEDARLLAADPRCPPAIRHALTGRAAV